MENVNQPLLSSTAEGNSFSYLLPDTQTLNTTGFKVMQNLASAGLLPAYRSRLNGRLRLVYDIAGSAPLSAMAASLTPSQFTTIVKSLLELFGKTRSNGFIRMENLLLDADHVMVSSDWTVRLIYLPIDDHAPATAKLSSPELALRRLLTNFIDANPNVRSERVAQLNAALKRNQDSFQGAFSVLNADPAPSSRAKGKEDTALKLVSPNGTRVLTASRRGTVVGRDAARATAILKDGSVSGVHCRIFWDSRWLIEDLGSRNGTRINGVPLTPHKPEPLTLGDEVEISTLHFLVKE